MKVLLISDIHGRHERLTAGFDKFLSEGHDKVVLLGDLADSYDRSNEDILRCFKICFDMKELLGDKMEWLIGNHELHYMFVGQQCSGFRPDLAATLNPWLVENRKLLKCAYQEDMHLFTHAGVQKHWFRKYATIIHEFENKSGSHRLGDSLNAMLESGRGVQALTEVGVKRGGWRGDYGGPFWCDREEMESYGPVAGYHQYVGHTPQKMIDKVIRFEGGKHYNNTSVTFCDILDKREEFLTVTI